MALADLVEFCQDRGLRTTGSKAELIDDLLHWVSELNLYHPTHSQPCMQKEDTRPVPAPSTPQLFDDEDYPFSSATAEQQRLEQQRLELNSREFSALFLDGSPGLDIPYEELRFGRRLGCGGFKDCYAGKKDTRVVFFFIVDAENASYHIGMYKGEPVAIGELRLTQFNEVDLQEIKHEINVLK